LTDLRLERVRSLLPNGLAALREGARAEGYRHLDRLAADWEAGVLRFDRVHEALLAAFRDGDLVGVGGLTADPVHPNALRLRRFYIAPAERRCGIGRALALALLAEVGDACRPIVVNAAPGSEPFWESLGFKPDRRNGRTHILSRS